MAGTINMNRHPGPGAKTHRLLSNQFAPGTKMQEAGVPANGSGVNPRLRNDLPS